jgi:CheY-like chemotaxis protein
MSVQPSEQRSRDAGAGRKLSLLIVEDDAADAYLISRALAENPLVGTVTHARDGVEALAMVAEGKIAPDLAFIDLHMPQMNGFMLLSALANCGAPTFPMVVLTSSSAPNDAMRSRLRSAVQVVIKPNTVSEMYDVLDAAIAEVCPLELAAPRTWETYG